MAKYVLSDSRWSRTLKFGMVIGFALKRKGKLPTPKISIKWPCQGPLTHGETGFKALPHALRMRHLKSRQDPTSLLDIPIFQFNVFPHHPPAPLTIRQNSFNGASAKIWHRDGNYAK